MAVVIFHQGPGLTKESYEEAVRRLTGKARMESASDWPVEGMLVHTAGEAEGGFCVVDRASPEGPDATADVTPGAAEPARPPGVRENPGTRDLRRSIAETLEEPARHHGGGDHAQT